MATKQATVSSEHGVSHGAPIEMDAAFMDAVGVPAFAPKGWYTISQYAEKIGASISSANARLSRAAGRGHLIRRKFLGDSKNGRQFVCWHYATPDHAKDIEEEKCPD